MNGNSVQKNPKQKLHSKVISADYDISNSFSLGIEARNHNVIKEGELEHSALFAGPVASFLSLTGGLHLL